MLGSRRARALDVVREAFGEVANHVLVVRLEGPAADLEELGVAPELLDLVLGDVAVAAVDLDGGVGDVFGDGRGEELDAVGVEAVAGGGEVEVDGRRLRRAGFGLDAPFVGVPGLGKLSKVVVARFARTRAAA